MFEKLYFLTVCFFFGETFLEDKGENPRFEILGVFGSGKTTIANSLSNSSPLVSMLEDHTLNPYWGKNKLLDRGGKLAYDISFLVQHMHLVQSGMLEFPSRPLICDWSFQTDNLWASLRLSDDSMAAYSGVFESFIGSLPSPRGYLYISVDPFEIYSRIQKRGRIPELEIDQASIAAAHKLVKQKVDSIPIEDIFVIDESVDLNEIIEFVNEKLR